MKWKQHISKNISFILIVLWSYAAISKLADLSQTRSEMLNQVFSHELAEQLTWLIPAIEILIIGLLLYQPARKIGLWASFGLLTLFSTYIILAVTNVFGRIPCSCGGILGSNSDYWDQLWFNILFISISLVGILMEKGWFDTFPLSKPKTKGDHNILAKPKMQEAEPLLRYEKGDYREGLGSG